MKADDLEKLREIAADPAGMEAIRLCAAGVVEALEGKAPESPVGPLDLASDPVGGGV